MKPIEVALRTNKNDKAVPPDVLPQGLMIAAKDNINDNKFDLKNMSEIGDKSSTLMDLKMGHQDNYLSILKKPEGI